MAVSKVNNGKVPGVIYMTAAGGSVRLQAADQAGGKKLRCFDMKAYTGVPLKLWGWGPGGIVVDLAGLRGTNKSRPIFLNHDPAQIVGHSTGMTKSTSDLDVSGVVSGASEYARQVTESSDNEFPWQASIGANLEKVIFVEAGQTAKANGQEYAGPVYVARKSTLFEISFVPLGADDNTSAKVAASAAEETQTEVYSMDFEKWLEAMGLKLADLGEEQAKKLRAKFDAEQAGGSGDPKQPAGTPAGGDDGLQAERERQAAETERVAKIRDMCSQPRVCATQAEMSKIEAEAIRSNWSMKDTELAILRADRPRSPSVASGRAATNAATIEAALCMGLGLNEEILAKHYGDQVMTSGRRLRSMGIKRAIELCCQMEGKEIPLAFGNDTIRAGFSTVSLPGIISNIANRVLVLSYTNFDAVSTRISRKRPVNDFKAVDGYMLTMTGDMLPVGQDGEIKNLGLTEEKYSNQAETRGAIITLTRTMIINDDLGAFEQLLTLLIRKALLTREKVSFTKLLANANNFFGAAHGNYISGADTDLSISALGTAEQKALEQKDAAGDPVVVTMSILLVPPALKGLAEDICLPGSVWVNELTAQGKKSPNRNRFAGRFTPECSPYLAAGGLANSSNDGWYLLADPAQIPVLEQCYLNGAETPVVEQGETDFDTLGLSIRCYFDFGVALADFRGGVMSKGKA